MPKYNKISIVDFSNETTATHPNNSPTSMNHQPPKKRGRPVKHKPIGQAQMIVKSTELLTVYSVSTLASKLQPYENEHLHFFTQSQTMMNRNSSSSIKKQNKMKVTESSFNSLSSTPKIKTTTLQSEPIINNLNQYQSVPLKSSQFEAPKRKIIRTSILSIKELLN